jgi:hypothetical protein
MEDVAESIALMQLRSILNSALPKLARIATVDRASGVVIPVRAVTLRFVKTSLLRVYGTGCSKAAASAKRIACLNLAAYSQWGIARCHCLGKTCDSRKIPIFEAMFEKHGELGYLFNDDTELKAIVERIVQAAEKSRYSCQVQNLGVRESPGIRKPWQPHIKNCAGKTGSASWPLKGGTMGRPRRCDMGQRLLSHSPL